MLSLSSRKSSRKTYKKKNGYAKRPWSTYNPRKALWNPSDPYSDSFVHKFRRYGQLARLFTTTSNLPGLLEDAGFGAPQFTLGVASSDAVPGGLNTASFAMTYVGKLDACLNFQDFPGLFNEYKIDKIDVRIDLINGPSGQPNIAGTLPEMYVRYDPNDSTMPANFGDLAQSANTIQCCFSQKTSFHYSFVPKASMQVYGGAGTGFGAPSLSSVWFDTSGTSAQCEMYGLKFYFRNFDTTSGNGQIFQFQPCYYLSMRRPR